MARPLHTPFRCNVRGLTFREAYPDNVIALQSCASAAIQLVREPDNEQDDQAVAVHANGQLLGHLPRGVAARLAGDLDHGRQWQVARYKVIRATPTSRQPGLELEICPAS